MSRLTALERYCECEIFNKMSKKFFRANIRRCVREGCGGGGCQDVGPGSKGDVERCLA